MRKEERECRREIDRERQREWEIEIEIGREGGRDNGGAEKRWCKQERNKQDNHIAMTMEYFEINI